MTPCTPHPRTARLGPARLLRVSTAAVVTAGAVLVSATVRAQLPWLHVLYLPAVVLAAAVAVRLVCWRRGRPTVRWPALTLAALSLTSLVPVPWLIAAGDSPPGTAWRLDGRLVIDGQLVDPPGRWYWLTAGRPPLAGEVVLAHLGARRAPRSLDTGNVASRPRSSEPLAASVGLTSAGRRAELPPDAYLGGRLARTIPGRWFRGLSLGRSHGLIVALAAYAWSSGHDVAQGRNIAGTGGVGSDGSVRPVGALAAKATAARNAGVDVLVYPAAQADDLDGFDPGRMRLVPVSSVAQAISFLASPSS